MGGSYAFSPVGYSGSYAGFGDTEAARANTALKYRVEIQNFRFGGLCSVGGYDQGNGTAGFIRVRSAETSNDFPEPGAFPSVAAWTRELCQGRGEPRPPRVRSPSAPR